MNRYQRRALKGHKRASRAAGLTTVCLDDQLEEDEQREVVQLYRTMGCKVYSLSQPRATMQTPGIADLYILCPRKSCDWWHEVKRPKGGKQSADQKEFQGLMEACGGTYLLGGFDEAYAHLERIGVIAKRGTER